MTKEENIKDSWGQRYDIYTKYDLRLIEVHSYINGRPKLIEKKSNNVKRLCDVVEKNTH